MRILLVTPFVPHPDADHGGGVYLGHFCQALLERGETVGVVHYDHGDEPAPIDGVQGFPVPRIRPRDASPFTRFVQRLSHVWNWGVRGIPLEVCKLESDAFRRALHAALTVFRPDVVLVEFCVMAWCLPELSGQAVVFTDHERGESVPRRIGPGRFAIERDRRLWKEFRKRTFPMARLRQALNEADAAWLAAEVGVPFEVRRPILTIPEQDVEPGAQDPVILFFGNFDHHPNTESVVHLACEVLPRVRAAVPEAELWLVGPHAGPSVDALGDLPGVRVMGRVRDLPALIAQARCLAAPMFSGYGFRVKVLEAMASGLPVVANELGLAGVLPPDETVGRGETADELAAACVRFLRDPEAATRAGRAARAFVRDTFRADEVARQQVARFTEL